MCSTVLNMYSAMLLTAAERSITSLAFCDFFFSQHICHKLTRSSFINCIASGLVQIFVCTMNASITGGTHKSNFHTIIRILK